MVARRLYSALQERFEHPLFVAFCHVNAERMLDAIDAILERGAWPLARDGLLAELYVRVYEHVRELKTGPRSGARASLPWQEPDDEWTIFDMLVTTVELLVIEQVDFLAACELPLPGMKLPDLDPGDGALDRTQSLLGTRGTRISGTEARHWIVHSLLRMPAESRRLLFLREKKGLSYRAIAKELGITPFEAGVRVRRAVLDLEDRILKTQAAFEPSLETDEDAERIQAEKPVGRLLTLRKRGEAPQSSSGSEREHDD
jgi:hypothetical protein